MSYSKADLREKLRALGAVPPEDATAAELNELLRRVRALKTGEEIRPPQGNRVPPPPAARQKFEEPAGSGPVLAAARLPATDHHRRPHDPAAGW